ncbi:MAG: ComEC/Rec2 family competence protein [Pseudobdellovibrio sp.]|nr:ComEC/Rec2 family competence protein [Pseudobdellovibrio sp.]
MNFVYILIYLSLISHTVRFSIVDFLIGFFSFAHVSCLKSAPENVRSVESLHALVCGKNFSDVKQSNLLIASGLIHLFVVSGSHLKILHKIVFYLLCNKYFSLTKFLQLTIFSLLFFYCAICKFNPPIFRSFIALVLLAVLTKYKLRWRTEQLILISGLICLGLSPQWINSLSFQMSWIASLTLAVINFFFVKSSALFKNSLFYVNYLTTFNFIGIPHPLSIGVSTLLTKFLEYVLFPLALAVYLFPFLGKLFDVFIFILNSFLSRLELTVIFRSYENEKLIFLNWILILSIHLFLNRTSKAAQHA